MSQKDVRCTLCGLEVKITGFSVFTPEGKKAFCCEGCKATYSLLHTVNVSPNQHYPKN